MLLFLLKNVVPYFSSSSIHVCSFLCICVMKICIRATSGENLFMPYANNKAADQPAHLRSLISAFVVHCLDRIIDLVAIAEVSRP